jgi:hypothetical protein
MLDARHDRRIWRAVLIAGGILLANYSNASLTQPSNLSKPRATVARGAR